MTRTQQPSKRTLWTFVATTIAFMVVLDNLVVSTAIPVLRTDLGASLEELEWTVNAFTLTFVVFLLARPAVRRQDGKRLTVSLVNECAARHRVAGGKDWSAERAPASGVVWRTGSPGASRTGWPKCSIRSPLPSSRR
jgi:hypothetical protein